MKTRLMVLIALVATGCDEKQEYANWRRDLGLARKAVIEAAAQRPFQRPQQEAFKAYFGRLQEIVLNADHDEKFSKGLASTLQSVDAAALCQDTLLPAEIWADILRGCRKNRFFLCSEEVRAYPEILEGIRLRLKPETARRLTEARGCWIARTPE